MAKIIDGKLVSEKIKLDIKAQTEELKKKGVTPGLAVVLVGDDPASKIYVNNKKKACEFVGFASREYLLGKDCPEHELISLIRELNEDKEIDGILVQLPLPHGIDQNSVIETIAPNKDVDAFTQRNVGKIMLGEYDFLPCTPAGIMRLLKYYGVEIEGRECVVVGRSNIVGKPMSMLLLHENATVTICHSKTRDLKRVCTRADILIAAVGKAKFITADMVKPGAVVIDVGMNRDEDNKLCGDVDFCEVEKKAGVLSPVPGGVGPMTIAMLMQNTLTSAKNRGEREA